MHLPRVVREYETFGICSHFSQPCDHLFEIPPTLMMIWIAPHRNRPGLHLGSNTLHWMLQIQMAGTILPRNSDYLMTLRKRFTWIQMDLVVNSRFMFIRGIDSDFLIGCHHWLINLSNLVQWQKVFGSLTDSLRSLLVSWVRLSDAICLDFSLPLRRDTLGLPPSRVLQCLNLSRFSWDYPRDLHSSLGLWCC